MRTLITHGRIVNEGKCFDGSLVIEDEVIAEILEGKDAQPAKPVDQTIDAAGCMVMPGIIDSHVHFREPGLTDKATIESESRAAAAGGVTSYFDMPNTVPQTTTLQALDEKFRIASHSSHVNYSFFFGATNDNAGLFDQLDIHRIPGIKLFMGSSTGNMLVDREQALDRIFSSARLPIMAHCEDTAIINQNMQTALEGSDDPDVSLHPFIRSEEACLVSTRKAIGLARRHHARLHVAHVSTAEELELLSLPQTSSEGFITAEVCVGYLLFSALDYQRLGSRIKVNPAIKSPVDQFMLRQALNDGRITTIATDHAPHLLAQKQGGCAKAASGMPMVQFSLVSMLELVDAGVLTIERLVELMAHHPARLFEVRRRGYLRPGYQADIVIVRKGKPWQVTTDIIQSKCRWSPLEGHQFRWQVDKTFCNGHLIYNNKEVDGQYIGQSISFR
ncbi:MAG: dihydroorotase [Prevotella sp.]|nr:dihydroorotase [Prevotella sp.]